MFKPIAVCCARALVLQASAHVSLHSFRISGERCESKVRVAVAGSVDKRKKMICACDSCGAIKVQKEKSFFLLEGAGRFVAHYFIKRW